MGRRKKKVCKENHGHSTCSIKREGLSTCPSGCQVVVSRRNGKDWVCDEHSGSKGTAAWIQDDPNHKTRQAPPKITRAEILRRAMRWVQHRIRYSQKRYHSDPTISGGKAYRMDCTGFVSMAWGIPMIGTARWVVGEKDKNGRIFSSKACKDLRPGDALVNQKHIILFLQWTDRANGKFDAAEEMGTAYGTVAGGQTFADLSELTGTGARVKSRGQYFCIGRHEIAE